MRPGTWKPLLWRLLGMLCYLAGMLVFLFVALDAFARPSGSGAGFGPISDDQTLLFGLSFLLIVLGTLISRRLGGSITRWAFGNAAGDDSSRQQSVLEEYGYVTPEPDEERPRYEYDEEGDAVHVYCPNCDARNRREYTYCRNCSAELPS